MPIVEVQFRTPLTEKCLDELRAVIFKDEYADVRFCELIGLLEMLKLEMYERNK